MISCIFSTHKKKSIQGSIIKIIKMPWRYFCRFVQLLETSSYKTENPFQVVLLLFVHSNKTAAVLGTTSSSFPLGRSEHA